MRFRVFVVVLMFVLMVSVAGVADTFKEILPGIGDAAKFGVFPAQSFVNISNTGALDVKLVFNYPGSQLIPILDHDQNGRTFNWYPGDLLFVVGSNKYGIPLIDHSFQVVDANAAPTVNAFDVYQTSAFLTADDLLAGLTVSHRSGDAFVWIGDTPVLLGGPLGHNISHPADPSTGEFIVTISGQLPAGFASDIAAHGFTAYFASTECANGYMETYHDPGVPEPASLALLGTGLLGLGVVRNRFSRAK